MRAPKGNVEEAKRLLQYTDDTYRTIGVKTGCSHGTIARLGKEYRCNRMTPAERWKAEHDDLMEKYNLERIINGGLEETNKKLRNNITQLESQLEAYQTNNNPQMVSKLNARINDLHGEIKELHDCLKDADEERDEAKAQAEQAMADFKKLHKEHKEYEMEYEARYKNMKAQRDHYAAVARLQLEVSE